jgi:hypothetical protein
MYVSEGFKDMSTTHVTPEAEVVANQKTILDNQAILLKNQSVILHNQDAIKHNQDDIKKNQETLAVIVKNQEKILSLLVK